MLPLLLVACYLINCTTGQLLPGATNITNASSLVRYTNTGTNDALSWAFVLIPFVVLLFGIGFKWGLPVGGFVGSIVAAAIALLMGQILGAPAQAVTQLQLYLFIALTVLFAVIMGLEDITSPYGR